MKRLRGTLTILILAALLVPATSMAQEPVACESNYTVQVGDWLSKIAEKHFGNVLTYPAIVLATNLQTDGMYTFIANPDMIEPGWTLCIPSTDDAATLMAMSIGTAPQGLSPQELANATYSSEFTNDRTAPLTDGMYGEPAAPDSAAEIKVVLLPDTITYGRLNGQDVAAVVLATDSGGSGTFYYLHVMVTGGPGDGQPAEVASTFLGDRVQINSITIKVNQIGVDMVQAGPDDPMCCPTQRVVKTYELQGDQLVETSSQVVEAEGGPTTLEGTSWILTTLNGAEPLPDTTVTANFEADGNLAGSDGCNRYGARYEVDGDRITITPGMSTMMACPEPIMKQATDYMAALEAATSYQIQDDRLELRTADGALAADFAATK